MMKSLLDKITGKTVPSMGTTLNIHTQQPQSTINAGMGIAIASPTYIPNVLTNMTSANNGYGNTGQILTTTGNGAAQWSTTAQQTPNPDIISLRGDGNKEIVRLTKEGEVIWADGIKVDEAAEAFTRTIYLSTEMKAGITARIKSTIRNSLFDEIIHIAKVKGSLTADELTLMLEASKIMEKLKGV